MEVAVDQIKCKFVRKIGSDFVRKSERMFVRDADFARKIHLRIARKRDDIGRFRIVQKLFMQIGNLIVVEKNDRKIAFWCGKEAAFVEGVKKFTDLSWFVMEFSMAPVLKVNRPAVFRSHFRIYRLGLRADIRCGCAAYSPS